MQLAIWRVIPVTLLCAVAVFAIAQQTPPAVSPEAAKRAKAQPVEGNLRAQASGVVVFGAKGDGIADDTDAIQSAVNAKAGAIVFPAGEYRITKPIVVNLDQVGVTSFTGSTASRIVMAGPGPAIRFVGTHGGTAAPESAKPEVWERQRMPVVEGLAIEGDHPEADGIEAAGTMQLTVRGVHIRRVRHGIHLVERNRNVLIDACHIYENSGCGVFLDRVNLHQTNISASHISYNDGGGVVVRGGEVRNVHINGCDIEANMGAEGPATANVLFDSTDGSMAEAAIVGCTIQHTGKAPDSANIRIIGRGFAMRDGMKKPFNCGHVTIGDNVLSDVQTNIHLDGVRGATILGNTFWQGFEHNLLIEDSSQIMIGENMMERNPLYGYTSEAKNNVILRSCRDCTINGLHLHHVIESEAGLTIEKCDRMHITGCTILDCENVGLLVRDTTNSRIANCFIRDNRENKQPGQPLKVVGGKGNSIDPALATP